MRTSHPGIVALVLTLVAVGPLSGCKGDAGAPAGDAPATSLAGPRGAGDVAASQGGAASPEAAFEQFKNGVNTKDHRAFFQVLAKESQDQMLVGLLLAAGITLAPVGTKPNPNKKKELDAIFDKHGVKDGLAPAPLGSPDKMTAAIGKRLEGVKDRPGLFNDLMRFVEKNSLHEVRSTVISLEGLKPLGDDKATGVAVLKHTDGKMENHPVEFRKVGGRWYVFVTKWR